jgi:hypothetical protein
MTPRLAARQTQTRPVDAGSMLYIRFLTAEAASNPRRLIRACYKCGLGPFPDHEEDILSQCVEPTIIILRR